ncbi:MAG: hypothetical protein E7172_04695 [Firmicutes bacterium]|nr:hypothetical protein [Bacillota bacterium]
MGDYFMSKKESFKEFVKNKPELIEYVNENKMTWQKFYEIYDLYGEDESAWTKFKSIDRVNINDGISKISNLVKNVDVNSIKNHINTAQKALDLVQDFTLKKPDNLSNISSLNKGPVTPRPLNKFFED